MKSLILPNSVIKIGANAFEDCNSLQSIHIPNSVFYIGESAFYGCESLLKVNIPNSVKTLEACLFQNCISLHSIRFHHSNTQIKKAYISDEAFEDVDFDKCILYIPSGTRWEYRHDSAFSQFKNIVTEIQR